MIELGLKIQGDSLSFHKYAIGTAFEGNVLFCILQIAKGNANMEKSSYYEHYFYLRRKCQCLRVGVLEVVASDIAADEFTIHRVGAVVRQQLLHTLS